MKNHFCRTLLVLLVCFALLFGFAACGRQAEPSPAPLPEASSHPKSSEEAAEEPSTLPEESEPPAEEPPLGFPEPDWVVRENAALEENYQKLMESREEVLSLLNQRLIAFREGTFEEMPNHHAPWREDFPSPMDVTYPLTYNDYVVWKTPFEVLDETTTRDGDLTIWVKLDQQNHWMVLTPVWFGSAETEETTLGFSDSGFYQGEPPFVDYQALWTLQNP